MHNVAHQISRNSNSGDEIRVVFENGELSIRKRSYVSKERLKAAAILQTNYEDKTLNTYSVPIKSIRIFDEFTEIEMPFVQGYSGQNLYTYVSPAAFLQICDRLTTSVLSKIDLIYESYSVHEIRDITKDKLNSVKLAIQSNRILGNVSWLSKKIEEIVMQDLCYIRDDCPRTIIHGDLTLSNVIYNVKTDKIWLIDFLPTYLDSPIVDLAKLIQEFKYCWSARYLSQPARTTSKIVGRTAMENLLERVPRNYCRYLKVLSIMNLYRILPYTKDQITFSWVVDSLNEEVECEY